MNYPAEEETYKEGFVVSLGQNVFSLPKLLWFSLRSSGLFYSTREKGEQKMRYPESVIEFDSMFVRVEKLEDDTSRFTYRNDKIAVYCLRVGDKRKCRLLCFTSWEERDFWVIGILTAIAQFKISGKYDPQTDLCGKIRCGTSSSTLRASSSTLRANHRAAGGTASTSSARIVRSSLRRSFRKKFGSLRSRKGSVRDSRDGVDFRGSGYMTSSSSDVFSDSNTECGFKTISAKIEDCKTKGEDGSSKGEADSSSKGFFKSGWDVIRRKSPSHSQLNRSGSLRL